MVTMLVLLSTQIIVPYLWYEKLSSTCIKYIYVMEEFGYLTSKEANILKEDLERQGFDIKKIKLQYTNKIVDYGDPIFLNLKYDYEMKLPIVGDKKIEMQVERNSVSKR